MLASAGSPLVGSRDFFSKEATAQGARIAALIPIPPTESSFTKYF